MDVLEREQILDRYAGHARRFDELRARRASGDVVVATLPLLAPLERLEQDPTSRELEVLQLIADGLANREIGRHLYLSEETIKSHVRHLLAKLQSRSRAHAVAVGLRRRLIN